MTDLATIQRINALRALEQIAEPVVEPDPPCYLCGEPCGNPQGRHYECACEYGEDLDATMGFNDLAHIW